MNNLFTFDAGEISPGFMVETDTQGMAGDYIRIGRVPFPDEHMRIRLKKGLYFQKTQRRDKGRSNDYILKGNFEFRKEPKSLVLTNIDPPKNTIFVLIKYKKCSIKQNAIYVRSKFIRDGIHKDAYHLLEMTPGGVVVVENTDRKWTLKYEEFEKYF